MRTGKGDRFWIEANPGRRPDLFFKTYSEFLVSP